MKSVSILLLASTAILGNVQSVPTDPLPRPAKKIVQARDVGDEIRLDLKRKEALEMVVNYTPVKDIADHFSVTQKTIYSWIEQEHDNLRQAMSKNASIYKARLNQTYDELMRQWKSLALKLSNELEVQVSGTKIIKGKPVEVELEDWEIALAATDRVLKIAKQQADLNQIGPIEEQKGTTHIGDMNLQLIQIVQEAFKKPELPVKEAEVIEANPIPA